MIFFRLFLAVPSLLAITNVRTARGWSGKKPSEVRIRS